MVFFSFGFRNGDKNVCLPEPAAASSSGCSCSNFVKPNGGGMVG